MTHDEATSQHPNPRLPMFQTWAILPFCLDAPDGRTGPPAAFHKWFDSPFGPMVREEDAARDSSGWHLRTPEELVKDRVSRWFSWETRALFKEDERTLGKDPTLNPADRKTPKLRWLALEQGANDFLDSARMRLAVVHRPQRGNATFLVLPQKVQLELSAIVSRTGIILFLVRFTAPRSLTLADAMLVNHTLAYPGPEATMVLLPKTFVRHPERSADSSFVQVTVPLETLQDNDQRCTALHLDDGPVHAKWNEQLGCGAPLAMRSLDYLLPAMSAAEAKRAYPVFQGRVPLFTHLLLPGQEDGEDGIPEAVRPAVEPLEMRAARAHRHPRDGGSPPLHLADMQGQEFRTMGFSDSLRAHISCEGVTAWGYHDDGYDLSGWPNRLGREFLLTFLLAQHQAAVCLDLSWRSYSTAKGPNRDNESLVRHFLDYNTEYDFAVVSNQLNIQRFYRLTREALGVESIANDVRQELSAWQEEESRKEQGALNSFALVALMGAFVTFFVGLNLKPFSADATIHLLDDAGGLAWWFWGPLVLVLLFLLYMLRKERLKRHITRIRKLLE